MASPLESVFEPGFLRKLDRLRLNARPALATLPGTRPTSRGSFAAGMEMSRHKPYAPGDDLRHLDWNAFGRLDELLVKTFHADRALPLHVFIDCSASMDAPHADNKLSFAAALAASLAYIALRQHDPMRIICLGGGDDPFRASDFVRHLQRLPEIRALLMAIEPRGVTHLHDGVGAYLQTAHIPGVAVLLSDFLVPPAVYESALSALARTHCATAALHISGPRERHAQSLPEWARLRDVETGLDRIVHLTQAARSTYAAAWLNHQERLKHWCSAHGVAFSAVDTACTIETCLFSELPRTGLLH